MSSLTAGERQVCLYNRVILPMAMDGGQLEAKLRYGTGHLPVRLPAGSRFLRPAPAPQVALRPLLEAALYKPYGARLEELSRGRRVLIVVSDATRHEPRAEMLAAVLARMPEAECRLAIANGTHEPRSIHELDLGTEHNLPVINHDSRARNSLVEVGTSTRGTPFVIHRDAAEAELIVLLGQIKPHYFAGYGAGIKGLFPGLGGEIEIRINHQLKREDGARLGKIDGNPCREDLEEILGFVSAPVFILNTVVDAYGTTVSAVAGCPRRAFREGAAHARPWYSVALAPARTIIATDAPWVTASLYQASKMTAAMAPFIADGGQLILLAPCQEGTGPLQTVNQGIFELGIRHRFPGRFTVRLKSEMPDDVAAKSYCTPVHDLRDAIADDPSPLVVDMASTLMPEAREPRP